MGPDTCHNGPSTTRYLGRNPVTTHFENYGTIFVQEQSYIVVLIRVSDFQDGLFGAERVDLQPKTDAHASGKVNSGRNVDVARVEQKCALAYAETVRSEAVRYLSSSQVKKKKKTLFKTKMSTSSKKPNLFRY